MSNSLPLWQPTSDFINKTNMKAFMDYVNQHHKVSLSQFENLYDWSIKNPENFWSAIWDFCKVISPKKGNRVIDNPQDMMKAKFFPDATLNFAQNLLRRRDNDVALEFFGEDRVRLTYTFNELYNEVSQFVQLFKDWGVRPGDRIAGYMPNMPHTIIAMLAASTLGAIWSSCSPDFGVKGVIDRFGQINPKILICPDAYYYGGKKYDILERLEPLLQGLKTVEKTLVVPYTVSSSELKSALTQKDCYVWDEMRNKYQPQDITFEQFEFNHPLYIMYSSGTTGVPKCILHGAGGTLLQHLKEHQLHSDIKRNDHVFYYTTCGWMMWNWLVSALASEATLILFDGSPTYPHPAYLFDIIDQTHIRFFGTSAKYLDSLSKLEIKPAQTHKLKSLEIIGSTGSPLAPETFDYVYQSIKKDICLSSLSGGTDIISCFALGNPMGPVWRGELQTRGLGLNVKVYNEHKKELMEEKGELVCIAPFPCQPLGFWNDEGGEKYRKAYFEVFENIWCHGDYVELTDHGGLIFYGRSDAVLNPGGVRIGTAEIYRQVEQVYEVLESIAVGQQWDGDERVVLFVKLRNGIELNEELMQKIKTQIRQNTTPRHVPDKIIQIPDIPRTKSGKISEIAVRQTIHGEAIKNKEALANPASLDYYKDIAELQS